MAHEVRDPALERARREVKAKRDFYYHLMVFVLVNALLVFVDLSGGAGNGFLGLDFAHWVIFGWAFGIIGHAISVFMGESRVRQVYERERNR